MRTKIEIYKLWAPTGVLWTEWVKPVVFANMVKRILQQPDIPELRWISLLDRSAAIIVDLPGKEGVLEGLALAKIGYRPIPLYNGVCGNPSGRFGISAVPVHEIEDALYCFADELPRLNLKPDAPPAFLLDANRMQEAKGFLKTPGDYDNRWSIFPQDMPSASYLQSKGIRNVFVRSDKIRDDLAHILYRYETQGITVYLNDGTDHRRIAVSKPSKFKSLFYRFGVILGLRRNSAGGFGGLIPESGGSG